MKPYIDLLDKHALSLMEEVRKERRKTGTSFLVNIIFNGHLIIDRYVVVIANQCVFNHYPLFNHNSLVTTFLVTTYALIHFKISAGFRPDSGRLILEIVWPYDFI